MERRSVRPSEEPVHRWRPVSGSGLSVKDRSILASDRVPRDRVRPDHAELLKLNTMVPSSTSTITCPPFSSFPKSTSLERGRLTSS